MTAQASEIQQVTDDVIFWQAYEPEVKADLTSSGVRGARGWVLIDPISLTRPALQELRETVEAVAIVLTNGNHARAAVEFRDLFDVPLLAHADAVADLGIRIDAEIGEGSLVGGDLTVLSVTGAGPGEIALHSPGKSLHLGDALINLEPLGFTFLPDKYCQSAKEMRRSLAELAPLDFTLLTFAHGLPLVSQAKSRFSQLLA